MYIPRHNRIEDQAKIAAFMRGNSFAALISILDGVPWATHIPILVEEDDTGLTLVGHLAKTNPHWKAFGEGETLAIFSGPHAYISPRLYETKESVPTWNYAAVHAYGIPQPIATGEAQEKIELIMAKTFEAYEPVFKSQYERLSDKYRVGLLHGVVGFEMPVTRLEARFKLSQDKSEAVQERVAKSLLDKPDTAAGRIGEMMLDNLGDD
ncbi:MAG: FMN-binding negative transcriptional regulator [Anaerolineae bacterium]|nr:FMN-binding negative transcriptional regulator [Anaerolineae bacterium]